MSTETQELKAGEKLDTEVAVKVMGRCAHPFKSLEHEGPEGDRNVVCGICHDEPRTPRYSTDIGDAWEVLESQFAYHLQRMKEGRRGFFVTIVRPPTRVSSSLIRFDAEGDSMPEAICLAALKSVEGQP